MFKDIFKKCATALLWLPLLLSAWSAEASVRLDITVEKGKAKFTIGADNKAIGTFVSGKELWLISNSDKAIDINLPTKIRNELGIKEQEILTINGFKENNNINKIANVNGTGIRLRFKKLPEIAFSFSGIKQSEYQALGIMKLKDGFRLSAQGASSALIAHSKKTNKSYVVVPIDSLAAKSQTGLPIGLQVDNIKFLPSLLGWVLEKNSLGNRTITTQGGDVLLGENTALLEYDELPPAGTQLAILSGKKPPVRQIQVTQLPKIKEKASSLQPLETPQINDDITVKKAQKFPQKTVKSQQVKPTKPIAVTTTAAAITPQGSRIILLARDKTSPTNPIIQQAKTASNNVLSAHNQPQDKEIAELIKTVKTAPKTSNAGTKTPPKIKAKTADKTISKSSKVAKIVKVTQPSMEVSQTNMAQTVSITAPITPKKPVEMANFKEALGIIGNAMVSMDSVPLPKKREVSKIKKPTKTTENKDDENKKSTRNSDFDSEYANYPVALASSRVSRKTEEPDRELDKEALTDSLLFLSAVNIGEKPYRELNQRLLNKLVNAKDEKTRDKIRMRMAKLAVAFQRPQEALTLLQIMTKQSEIAKENPTLTGDNLEENIDEKTTKNSSNNGINKTADNNTDINSTASEFPADYKARLLMGATLVMLNRPQEGLELLKEKSDDKANLEHDRKLWLAAAYEALDKDEKAIEIFEKEIDISQSYPLHLQKDLRLAFSRALIRQEQITLLLGELKLLASIMPDLKLPPEGMLILARAYLIKNDDAAAENLMAQVAATGPPEIAFVAQYEFVSYLLDKGDIGLDQAIDHLEKLRFLWRGDELEAKILSRLGRIYLANGEQRKGLERLKYFTTYHYASEEAKTSTDIMSNSFAELFMSDNANSDLDPLAVLGLYYDFRELTPPGEKGDKLVLIIADKLRDMFLFERAIEVLERQLRFRIKEPLGQAQIGLRLAELYMLDLKYDDALNVLNRTEIKNPQKKLADKRDIIQSRVLLAMENLEEAKELLLDIDNEEARRLLADISWEMGDYNRVVKTLEPILHEDNSKKWQGQNEDDYMRLAVGYNSIDQGRELLKLRNLYKKKLSDERYKKVVDFLLEDKDIFSVEVNPDSKKPWDKIIKSMNNFNTFSGDYNDYKEKRAEEKIDRKRFNRRMRQRTAPSRIEG